MVFYNTHLRLTLAVISLSNYQLSWIVYIYIDSIYFCRYVSLFICCVGTIYIIFDMTVYVYILHSPPLIKVVGYVDVVVFVRSLLLLCTSLFCIFV